MRWPLRYQILLPFSGVMLLALVGVSVLNAVLATSRTQQQIEHQLASITDTLRSTTFPLNERVLKQMRGLSGAEFVLTTPAGDVLLTTAPMPDDVQDTLPAGTSERFRLGPTVRVGEETYFHTAISIFQPGGAPQSQLLHILYPERIWRESRWQAAVPPFIVGAVALMLVSLVAVVLTRRLTRPILQLSGRVGRLAQGDFQPLPLPSRNDELRDLVASVNSLALQLDELGQVIKRTERFSLLGKLSGGLAHHLRNTVTGARMAVQLHQRHCHEIDQQSLAVALRQLALTEEHLQRFLAAGRPAVPRRVRCDLRQVVAELVTLVEPACRHRKVELQVDPCAESFWLSADPDQLRQALLNLMLNAVDAAGGGGWARIEISKPAENQVGVRVSDSGPGPSAEVLEKLFEPFVTDKPEGVGLGLTVARQVATAHHGSLRFAREGATSFELVLPVELAAERQRESDASTPGLAAATK